MYDKALRQSPDDQALNVAAGRLAVTLLRYDDAVRRLEPAQARASYDPEIAYYLGLAYEGLGRMREARLEFETARRMPRFRAAGNLKLAELLAREGDVVRATTYLEQEPADRRAREELAALRGKRETAAIRPESVLRIAAQHMRLGQWREALAVLGREYPQPPAEQIEPGVPLPQKNPVVAYYRAFCRRKLGEPAAADYAIAAKLPAAYVFPYGAQTLEVIESAVRERPDDAMAHFLLGSLRMASGLADAAIGEWRTARNLNPSIPVLDADLGRTLLRIKRDVPSAAEAFRAGLANDPSNTELYTGLSTALGMMGMPAAETVAALERYPDRAAMPAAMVYDLALSYAEDRRFDRARAMFEGRFFPREEGGTNVRQVWIRVRALEAASDARGGRCSEALAIVDHIGGADAQLAFTRDGLDPFIAAAPNQASLGTAEARCGRADAASRRLQGMIASGGAETLVFAYELARQLPDFHAAEWAARLQPARAGGAGSSWSALISGMVELESGHAAEGRTVLESALLLPDRNLAHHLGRVLLRAAKQ